MIYHQDASIGYRVISMAYSFSVFGEVVKVLLVV